jgi:hypothetical protein
MSVVLAEQEAPAGVMVRGAAVAAACRQIVLSTTMDLRGKKYIRAEGWQALAAANGLSPRISMVEEMTNGDIRAVCDLIRLSDGETVASSEGFVGTDEPMWQNRPRYARRGMAQTRATSRACRSALAWIVPLLDADLSTTPAEEMDEPAPAAKGKAKPAQITTFVQEVVEAAAVVPELPTKAALERILSLYRQATAAGVVGANYWDLVREDYAIKTLKVSEGLTAAQVAEIEDHLLSLIKIGASK